MTFHIITLFPHMFDSYLTESILARAVKEKKIKVVFYNPRDYVVPTKAQKGKEKPYLRIDGKPYGGGPGMVMQAEPIIKIIDKIKRKKTSAAIIFLSPSGKQFDTAYARKLSQKGTDVIIICGRYEGMDARVKKIFKAEAVSAGPYVLTGGEVPAMAIIDCVSRQIEGVLGNFDSREESRVSSSDVYTRPEVLTWKGKSYRVPKILLSGDHAKIEEWKKNSK